MTSNNFPPATNIFDKKSSTNDGWDDWDWNDNSTNQQNPPKATYSQSQHLMHPSQQPAYPTNLHQQHPPQPHQQQQYTVAPPPTTLPPPPLSQSMHRPATDHLNNQLNYSSNQNTQNYYQGHPNLYQHQHQTQQQQPYNYSNPTQQQPPPPIDNNQAQNWQTYHHHDTVSPTAPPSASSVPSPFLAQAENVNQIFPKVSKEAIRKHDERETQREIFQQQKHNTDDSRQPDDIKNTQINNPTIARLIRNEHQLTPQWSIESQMSHTSSDRSIESDVLDSRSTNTSDEHQPMHHLIDGGSTMSTDRDDFNQNIDNLDEVLMTLNANKNANESFYQQPNVDMQPMSHSIDGQAAAQYVQANFNEPTSNDEIARNFYNSTPFDAMQNIPKSNVSQHLEPDYQMFHNQIDAQNSDNFQRKLSAGASQQQYLPSPKTEFNPPPPAMPMKNPTPPIATSSSFPSQSISPHPPPPSKSTEPPPAIDSTKPPSTNPFKRSGMPVHKTYAFPTQNQQHSTASSPFQPFKPQSAPPPPQPIHSNDLNQELLQPENAEIPDEMSANNDRNQYLQTGHLSEETYMAQQQQNQFANAIPLEADNLPPPGLSRLVLGQPETENAPTQSQQEPPPGLDRMIPGIEEAAANLNLERQADGQDTIDPLMRPFTIPTGHSHPPPDVSHAMDIPDRNLYRVPGESDISMQQRVVTGLDYRNLETPIVDQQRELDMDGENLDDPQQQLREEPIEGANTSDDTPQLPAAAANSGDNDPNTVLDGANKKYNSNPSTCDDSDKDRQMYYSRSTESRREDKRKRDKRHQRFDSEDTDCYSDQDKRRFNRDIREGSIRREHERSQEKEYQQDRQKSSRYKGGGGERGGKEKYKPRDYDKRYADRDHNDRYYRDRDRERDRYSRYESEGSRYETEDSRYDRYLKKGERRDDRGRRYRRDDRSDRERDRDMRDPRDRDVRDRDPRDRDIDAKKYSKFVELEPKRICTNSGVFFAGDHYYDGTKSIDRRRDKPRSRNDRYYDYDDEYRRSSSRNEMSDPDRSRGVPATAAVIAGQMPNYYPTNYGYDQYSYYQQQQYYETLRRTNPKAYAEWYKRYYSQQMAQAASDIGVNDSRDSVHSGRSSVNEKERLVHVDIVS